MSDSSIDSTVKEGWKAFK